MEGLSTELDFALKSRDPYPINLESLVDLLKYKHISSLTTHLKRHFQRDIDYKKFHQVRNKRQICVYYISVDCFKQICGFCRHTQRKEIAQNLLGNMTLSDVKSEDMSFTDMMMTDINDMKYDSDDEDDDMRMRQSSPPSKSIKTEKGNFVTKDPQSLLNRYGRTHLQNNMAMLKRGGFSETAPGAPAFSNNIYNFNNLSQPNTSTHITPIIPTTAPLPGKSALTSALAGAAFNPSSLTANALANAALANTNNVFNNNMNNSNFNPFLSNFTTPNSNHSYNTSFAPANNTTSLPSGPFIHYPSSSNPMSISSPDITSSSDSFTHNHKRLHNSSSPSKPITQVTSTITPTPIVSSHTLSSPPALSITAPITPTPVISTPVIPFTPAAPSTNSAQPFSFSGAKVVTPITPTKSPINSPAIGRSTPIPSKSGVTKNYGVAAKTGSILSYKSSEPEFKMDQESSTLFDFSAISQPEMQYYDDYLTLSTSPTSMFDPVNTLAEVDKIYEQWEQERGGPAWQ